MKKFMMLTMTALALMFGAGTAAYAWHGYEGAHPHSRYHGSGEHYTGSAQGQGQGQGSSFYQHGGGHEQTQNNAVIHDAEKNDPRHRDN